MPATGKVPDNGAAAEPRRIGERYRLTDPLGRGAMGTVWAGYDEVLHRPVAVKELRVPPGVPSGEMAAMRERMMREARTLGGLSHPNVITLFDVVDVAGDPYVVLELLPSRNLGEVIDEQGRLSVGQVASIGLAMAAALQAAHRAGITHRDVKPGNVLVAHDGRIKLTDFGIARRRDDLTMTATGLVLGSPAYIAPEVAAGEAVTPAADLWGLGATLFASTEGKPPYDVDGDPVKTVTAVVHDEVPRPRAAGPLADVITALMVKDPAGRMPLAEVRRRLRPMLTDPDDPLFPGSPDAFTPPPSVDQGSPSIGAPAVRDEPSGPTSGPIGAGGSAAEGWSSDGRRPTPWVSDDARGTGPSRPGPHRTFGPRPPQSGPVQSGPSAPLAADPGPLPGGAHWAPSPSNASRPVPGVGAGSDPRVGYSPDRSGGYPGTGQPGRPPSQPVAKPPRLVGDPPRGARSVPLVIAGALAVILGVAGGWAGTRVLVGQSPLSTVLISPGAVAAASTLDARAIPAGVYGPGTPGFTIGVPHNWEDYRLASENDVVSILFVSPDGSRELRLDRIRGSRAKPAQPSDFAEGLTAARLGVAAVTVQARSGNQLRYRTDRVGTEGSSSRVSYAQLTPSGTDLWVLQLTVPADAAGEANQQLFSSIAGFRPSGLR